MELISTPIKTCLKPLEHFKHSHNIQSNVRVCKWSSHIEYEYLNNANFGVIENN